MKQIICTLYTAFMVALFYWIGEQGARLCMQSLVWMTSVMTLCVLLCIPFNKVDYYLIRIHIRLLDTPKQLQMQSRLYAAGAVLGTIKLWYTLWGIMNHWLLGCIVGTILLVLLAISKAAWLIVAAEKLKN